jgi:hypothetical protein
MSSKILSVIYDSIILENELQICHGVPPNVSAYDHHKRLKYFGNLNTTGLPCQFRRNGITFFQNLNFLRFL